VLVLRSSVSLCSSTGWFEVCTPAIFILKSFDLDL
jgi:hypothetical protein